MTPLCELALKYGTDKCGPRHQYTSVYYYLLRNKKVARVLEVGIYRGASLRMWRDFFPNAEIFGFDFDPQTMFKEDRITCSYCDQLSVSSMYQAAVSAGGNFDLIIEDGSHAPADQVRSAEVLLPFLAPGGIYVVEDLWGHEAKVPLDDLLKRFPSSYSYIVPDLLPTSNFSFKDSEQLLICWDAR